MNRYHELYNQYPDHLIFLKSGRFYQVRNESAYLVNYLFGFRLYLSKEELCTGCPAEVLNRIKEELKRQQISYIILNQDVIEDLETYPENHYSEYQPLFEVMEKKRLEELAERNGQAVDREVLKKTISVLKRIEPLEDDKLKKLVNSDCSELQQMREAMECAQKILSEVLQYGIRKGSRTSIQTPFQVDIKSALQAVTMEPLKISGFTAKLNESLKSVQGAARKLGTSAVTNWLMKNRYLQEITDSQNNKIRIATELGETIGIKTLQQESARGVFQTNWYDQNAQRFLVEHLNEICC